MVFGMITGISYSYLNPAVSSLCPPKSTTQSTTGLSIQHPSTLAAAPLAQEDSRSPESLPRLSNSDVSSPGSRLSKRRGSGAPDLLSPSSEYLQSTISRITTTIENTSQQVNSKFQSFRSFLSNSNKQQPQQTTPTRPPYSSSKSARASTGRTLFSPPTRQNSTDMQESSSQRQRNSKQNGNENHAATNKIDVSRTDSVGDTAPPIFDDDRLSITNISRSDAFNLLECYFIPIITNDQQVITSCQFILEIYQEWKSIEIGLNSPKLQQKKTSMLPSFSTFQHTKSTETEAFVVQLLQPSVIHQRTSEIMEQMLQKAQSQITAGDGAGLLLDALFPLLQAQAIYQNKQLSLKWSLLLNTIKMMMSKVKERLLSLYTIEMEIFWKQQQMIHTRRYFKLLF
jgi:hypothetical protein